MSNDFRNGMLLGIVFGVIVGVLCASLFFVISGKPVAPVEPVETTEAVEPETTEAAAETENTEATEPPETEPVIPVNPKPVVKTKYVSASVLNVRKGAGVEFDVIGILLRNTEVVVNKDLGDWSEINFESGTAYVSSAYLVDEQIESNDVIDEIDQRGSVGRLYVDELGLTVALFNTYDQKTVDRPDSAAILFSGSGKYGQDVIADHVNQGFDKMKKAIPEKTKLRIDYGTNTKNYICISNFKGWNTGYDLTDSNYISIGSEKYKNENGVCLYTCNSDGTIQLTQWRIIN